MSGSCCGGSVKSEPNKVATMLATQETEAVAEKPAANNSDCCSDKPERRTAVAKI